MPDPSVPPRSISASEPKTPGVAELGIHPSPKSRSGISSGEIIALVLTLAWLVAIGFLFFGPSEMAGGDQNTFNAVITLVAVIMPIALIWVVASAARSARVMREEVMHIQSSIDGLRASHFERHQHDEADLRPAVVKKLEEIAEAQRRTQSQLAVFTSLRNVKSPEERAAVVVPEPDSDNPQTSLGLGTRAEELKEPISVADFIKALDFPENEHDKEGFRTLRCALEDPATRLLVRASQDVLTLLSQDGIYVDDLNPDRARPETWRQFAAGERGRSMAALGGVRDRSSLALSAGRMKQDMVFKDAVHHFLRQFDKTFVEFEKNASDEEIVRLTDTRTARAFMLLGRVTGAFD